MTFSQNTYDIRCEWGLHGAELLSKTCDAIIIVDVLSFSTAVTIAVENGGIVYPYRFRDASRISFAQQHNAILAGPRNSGHYSLSPSSLTAVQSGEHTVLPSQPQRLNHFTRNRQYADLCWLSAKCQSRCKKRLPPR